LIAGFFDEKRISTKCGNKIHNEVVYYTVWRVFNITNIFGFIVNYFNYRVFSLFSVAFRYVVLKTKLCFAQVGRLAYTFDAAGRYAEHEGSGLATPSFAALRLLRFARNDKMNSNTMD
jgi:hypothetical protein